MIIISTLLKREVVRKFFLRFLRDLKIIIKTQNIIIRCQDNLV
jgi:hypothetical protein